MATTTNYGWTTPDDTALVKDGAAAIRTLGSSVDTSTKALNPSTTLGDIEYRSSTANTNTRLGIGTTGQVLTVAGGVPSWATPSSGFSFEAGKNKIINADFNINQRSFSSLTCSGTDQYGFDRWFAVSNTGTVTYSTQAFTAGTAPVTGYEGTNFARMLSTGQTGTAAYSIIAQKIESVRSFANQTITVSFWAKAAAATPKVSVEIAQNFGSGGSSQVNTYAGQVTLSTSWARYSVSVAVPSISGKTIGTGNFIQVGLWTSAGTDFNARTGSLGIQSATIDFWGVQAEAGSTATDFQTAAATIQGELALCQRYYFRSSNGEAYGHHGVGIAKAGNAAMIDVKLPVTMRVKPTSVDYSNLAAYDTASVFPATSVGFQSTQGTSDVVALDVAFSGGGATTYRTAFLINNNNAAGYIGLSAEL
jgi:hypothetical protein